MSTLLLAALLVLTLLAAAIYYVVTQNNIRAAEADLQTEKNRRRAVQLQLAMAIQQTLVAGIDRELRDFIAGMEDVRQIGLQHVWPSVDTISQLLKQGQEGISAQLIILDAAYEWDAPIVEVRVRLSSNDGEFDWLRVAVRTIFKTSIGFKDFTCSAYTSINCTEGHFDLKHLRQLCQEATDYYFAVKEN